MNGKWLLLWSRPLTVAVRVILLCSLIVGAGAPAVARAAPATPPLGCHDGQLGAQLIQICFPLNWNGTLIMYAHGYKAAQEPLALPTAELTINGIWLYRYMSQPEQGTSQVWWDHVVVAKKYIGPLAPASP